MRKARISLLLIISSFLILFFLSNSWAEDIINILNYSLKPVGYVDDNKSLQTVYNIELKNNQGTAHSFNLKIVFYDKAKNQLKESKTKYEIQANETKKYSDVILVDAELGKQISTTKGFIEDIQ